MLEKNTWLNSLIRVSAGALLDAECATLLCQSSPCAAREVNVSAWLFSSIENVAMRVAPQFIATARISLIIVKNCTFFVGDPSIGRSPKLSVVGRGGTWQPALTVVAIRRCSSAT